jgi:hypothetical protein
MKKLLLAVAIAALVGLAPCAFAAQVEVHGTLDNQVGIYDDQANFFNGDSTGDLDRTTDQFAAIKYRIRTEIGTDDNAVKGVFGIEVGADRFGSSSSNAPKYSGDQTSDIEVRFAYTDFMLGPGRLKFGLAGWEVNRYLWKETAPSVQWGASLGSVDLKVGWARGNEYKNTTSNDAFIEDQDALMARADFGLGQGSKLGVFALYQDSNPSTAGTLDSNDWYYKSLSGVDSNMWSVGVDGKMMTSGPFFMNWDLIYQNGNLENITFTDVVSGTTNNTNTDYDLSAYFAHLDLGLKLGKTTLTYTGWYASGDDNPNDSDFNAYLATDVDMNASIIFFEGGYTNDVYFTDRPYIFDKGMFFNRLGCDFQVNDKTTIGGAAIYAQTAEDMNYTDNNGVARSSSDLGIELDAYISYKMYKNLTVALNAGYLFAGDAMDYFEVGAAKDGSSDENIFRTTAHAVYSF